MQINLTEHEVSYWKRVSEAEFITEDGCYKKCGSFCCRWNSADMPFRIIPKGGTLFYMPKEYEYLKVYAKVPSAAPYNMSICFNKDKPPVKVYYRHCSDDNGCNILFSRSLFCKLYPFLPVFDIDGEITDVKYISVYDITAELIGYETPCFVKGMKDKYKTLWSLGGGNADLLREPYVLFHLMAASLLHDNYVRKLSSMNNLISLKVPDFWKKWEKEYLSGFLIDKDMFSSSLNNLYDEFEKKYNGCL